MRSIKFLGELFLLLIFCLTCKKGILFSNIDITGEWEWKEEKTTFQAYYFLKNKDSTYTREEDVRNVEIMVQNDSLFFNFPGTTNNSITSMNMKYKKFKKGDAIPYFDRFDPNFTVSSIGGLLKDRNTITFQYIYHDYRTSVGFPQNYVKLNGIINVILKRK